MYLLLSSVHCPNGALILTLISSHNVIISFFRILHADIVVWFLLGQFKSCIRLKVVTISNADFLK